MGRASTFSDSRIQATLQTHFICAVADDWYLRRRQDDLGRFMRRLAAQRSHPPTDGATQQGFYCFTPDGHLLAYRNCGQSADLMLVLLEQALQAWSEQPAAARAPGAVAIPKEGPRDARFERPLPAGARVLKVNIRALGSTTAPPRRLPAEQVGSAAATDHAWILADEIRALWPANAMLGQTFAPPPHLAERLVRLHALDMTRGEPSAWTQADQRRCELKATVSALSDTTLTLRLSGSFLCQSDGDPKTVRGYEAGATGEIQLEKAKTPAAAPELTTLQLVFLGAHWGESTYTPGAPPGRQWLGVSFDLLAKDDKECAILPQMAREGTGYLVVW